MEPLRPPERPTYIRMMSCSVTLPLAAEVTREVKSMLASIPKEDGVILCMQEVRSTTYDLIKGPRGSL